MKNKIFHICIVFLLSLFSFYYTEKVIEFIRETDPIMRKIKKESTNYEVEATNAKVSGNKIIPGVNGKIVDYASSYKKMKRYGKYNESLTVFKDVTPTISIDDYYDKYISEGNGVRNEVSLVFIIKPNEDVSEVLNILKENNVVATFFIDGLWLENNITLASEIKDLAHEMEILSYDNRYEELYFSSSLNTINKLTGVKPKYCFAKYDSKEVIELCSKLQLHTITPTIITGNYPYSDIKKKVSRGSIISFDLNSSTKIELPTIIQYLKQKGYFITTLDNLLSEAIDEK